MPPLEGKHALEALGATLGAIYTPTVLLLVLEACAVYHNVEGWIGKNAEGSIQSDIMFAYVYLHISRKPAINRMSY